jgi:hypothetical protein
MTWWAGGFVLQAIVRDAYRSVETLVAERRLSSAIGRAALTLAACAATLAACLWGARAYQQSTAKSMFENYLAVAKEEVPVVQSPVPAVAAIPRTAPGSEPETADFVQVDVSRWLCGDASSITFRYDKAIRREFARRISIARDDAVVAPTRIFMPIYDHFQGIELSDTPAGCVQAVYRVRDPRQIPLMLEVVLPPRWRRTPLYQRFGEVGPPELDAVQ